jgi:hypothetical protein
MRYARCHVVCSRSWELHVVSSQPWELHVVYSPSWELHTASSRSWELHALSSQSWELHTVYSQSWELHTAYSPSWELHVLSPRSWDLHTASSWSWELHALSSQSWELQVVSSRTFHWLYNCCYFGHLRFLFMQYTDCICLFTIDIMVWLFVYKCQQMFTFSTAICNVYICTSSSIHLGMKWVFCGQPLRTYVENILLKWLSWIDKYLLSRI